MVFLSTGGLGVGVGVGGKREMNKQLDVEG